MTLLEISQSKSYTFYKDLEQVKQLGDRPDRRFALWRVNSN